MAYAEHHRIVISGTIAAGGGVTQEIFSFSLCSSDALGEQALADAISADVEQWFHSITSQIPSWCTATELRIEKVATTGKVIASYGKTLNAVGGVSNTTPCGPAITCFAITLETGVRDSKGTKVRGRFFPPNSGYFVGTAALGAGAGTGQNIADSGAVLVTQLNNDGAVICVASQTDGGVNHTVTGTSADNIIDTQRRRKNHAVGTRNSRAVPYS